MKSLLRYYGEWMSRCPNSKKKAYLQSDIQFGDTERPVILISVCESKDAPGDYPYNGGIKLLNLWAKVLRRHGHEAYMVTYDGSRRPWLIEHQPHISIDQARRLKAEGRPLKFLTGWIPSKMFIDLADHLYFLDAELKYTCSVHFKGLRQLLKTKICNIATHSRTQQAWYMATFGLDVSYIPIWSDEDYWSPAPECRKEGRVGYMNEGEHTWKDIEVVRDLCSQAGISVDFMQIRGDEPEVLAGMRRCDIYLGLNPGKHPLWGEGSPLTQQEAMAAGCVVIAYDVFGNREYLIDGHTGFLAKRNNPYELAEHLVRIMKNSELKEQTRKASSQIVAQAFSSTSRWRSVRDFLRLPSVAFQSDLGEHGTSAVNKALAG